MEEEKEEEEEEEKKKKKKTKMKVWQREKRGRRGIGPGRSLPSFPVAKLTQQQQQHQPPSLPSLLQPTRARTHTHTQYTQRHPD